MGRTWQPVWEPITDPYVYGYRATLANHHGTFRVDVVRCYAGEWTVFPYRDGVQVRNLTELNATRGYSEMRKRAAQWLRHWSI